MDRVFGMFRGWRAKAQTMASNIWVNLKHGPSASRAAMGKLRLRAKALRKGGFESLYKETFPTDSVERLNKKFACCLSTTRGPIAGTLYLSNLNLAFCSDRSLAVSAPSGQRARSYYKIRVPLIKISAVNRITMTGNRRERCIQIVTIDGHEFWFMRFPNYDKASRHLSRVVSDNFAASPKPTDPLLGW